MQVQLRARLSRIARLSRLIAAPLILAAPLAAEAQIWGARAILAGTSSSFVLLKKDAETVDSIKRVWAQRVVSVTERLAPVYGISTPELFIAKQGGPNAFVTIKEGQQVMVVSTDMLRLAGDDEDLLAVVIGHELGHLKAEHLTQGSAKQAVVSLLGALAGLAVDISQARRGVDTAGAGQMLGTAGSNLVNAKFSRDQEREADDIGIRNMASAGFDPNAAPRLWKLMEAKGGGSDGLWLSSHPSHDERYKTLQAVAAVTTTNVAARMAAAPQVNTDDRYPTTALTSFALTAEEQAAAEPGPYRRGFEAHRAGQYDQAYPAFVEAAQSRDERALAYLGDYHRAGRGAPKDPVKALEYFTASAEKGYAPAIMMLGDSAQYGIGRAIDLQEARRLFMIAENRGWARASARLAILSLTGDAKDPVLARDKARLAYEKGDSLGRAVYGSLLRDGVGGPAEPAKSFELLSNVSDEPTLGFAHFQLAISYERGIGVAADKQKAAESYRRALQGGVAAAKHRLTALGFSE